MTCDNFSGRSHWGDKGPITNRVSIGLIGAVVPPFLKPVGSALGMRLETALQFRADTTGEGVDLPLCLCKLARGMGHRRESALQSVQGWCKRQHRKPWKR
jgi:hypothetical protein